MKLNFSSTPVPREAIEKAKQEAAEAVAKQRAIAFANDENACQAVVDAGRKHLRALRKAADDFAAEFKKLEGADSAPKFVEILNGLSIRSVTGTIRLTANYEDVEEQVKAAN